MTRLISKISGMMETFTNAQKTVASFFLYHIDDVAFGTVHDLAEKINVSTSTIVRFAQELGYKGFSELQSDARVAMMEMAPTAASADAVRAKCEENQMLEQAFRTDIVNLENTLKTISVGELNKAAELINNCRNVYVVGMRVNRSLSTYAFIHWGQARPNVRLIHNDSIDFPEEIADITSRDVLVAFWISRYNHITKRLMDYARKKNARIILISDVGTVPHGEACDARLMCYVNTTSYMHSLVAPMTVINYLTRSIEARYGTKAAKRLSDMDDLLGDGFFYR